MSCGVLTSRIKPVSIMYTSMCGIKIDRAKCWPSSKQWFIWGPEKIALYLDYRFVDLCIPTQFLCHQMTVVVSEADSCSCMKGLLNLRLIQHGQGTYTYNHDGPCQPITAQNGDKHCTDSSGNQSSA